MHTQIIQAYIKWISFLLNFEFNQLNLQNSINLREANPLLLAFHIFHAIQTITYGFLYIYSTLIHSYFSATSAILKYLYISCEVLH